MAFPADLPSYTAPDSSKTLDEDNHTARHTQEEADIVALGTKVGIDSSADTSSHDYKLSAVTGSNKAETQGNKDTSTSLGTSDTKFPSQKAVKSYVDAAIAANNLSMMPVGSYYVNETNSANPSTFLPGMSGTTWVAVTDKFLVGHGSTYTSTGGAATHTHPLSDNGQAAILVAASTPVIVSRRVNMVSTQATHHYTGSSGAGDTSSMTLGTALQGATDAGSTIPPYQAAYIWKRTA